MNQAFVENYNENIRLMRKLLRVEDSFDVLHKQLKIGDGELSIFFIDGFTKDTVMQKLMMHFISLKKVSGDARSYMTQNLPYIETDVSADVDTAITAVLSGCAVMLGSSFGAEVIIIDTRTYPARSTEEPEGRQSNARLTRRICGDTYFQHCAYSTQNKKSISDYAILLYRRGLPYRRRDVLYER